MNETRNQTEIIQCCITLSSLQQNRIIEKIIFIMIYKFRISGFKCIFMSNFIERMFM